MYATVFNSPGNADPPPITLNGATNDILNVNAGNYSTVVTTVTMGGNTVVNNFATITGGNNAISINNTFPANTATVNNATGAFLVTTLNRAIMHQSNGAGLIFNNAGTSDALQFGGTIAVPNIINNSGTLQRGGSFLGTTINLLSGSYSITINNSGTITGDATRTISTPLGSTGPITATINNSGTIVGEVSNLSLDTTIIYIFNAAAGSQLNGNYIGTAGVANQFNVGADGGSVSLGGNITNIRLDSINSGTLNTNGFNITGFDTFNVANGATLNQTGGIISGTTFNTSGAVNASSGTFGPVTTINVNDGGVFTTSGTAILNSTSLNINSGGTFNLGTNITANTTNNGTLALPITGTITTYNITGNYVQTTNGTFSPSIVSATNYSRIAVTGSTSIQGGTIRVNLPNGFNTFRTINPGDTFDVITSTGPLSYNLNTIITPVFFSLVPEALALNIVRLRATANSFRFFNTIPSLDSIAAALDQIGSNPPSPGLQELINALLASPNHDAFESALAQLSPNVHQAVIIPGLMIQQVLLDKIATRLDALRAASDFGKTGYIAGDLAGSCSSMGPIFYNNILTQQPVDSFPGYVANSYGIGFAGDMPISPYVKLGAGVGVSYTVVQPNGIMSDFGNSVKVSTVQPLIYGTFEYSPYFLDALFSWGYNSYNSERNIIFLQQRATSNFNGMQFSTQFRTGMVIPTCWFDLTLPLVSYQFAKLKQGPHSEVGGGATNLAIQGQKTEASQFFLGAKIAVVNQPQGFYYEIHGGGLLATQANRNLFVTASFVQGGPTWTLLSAIPSREGLNIGASFSLLFRENILFTAGYDYVSWDSLKAHAPWARLRWLF